MKFYNLKLAYSFLISQKNPGLKTSHVVPLTVVFRNRPISLFPAGSTGQSYLSQPVFLFLSCIYSVAASQFNRHDLVLGFQGTKRTAWNSPCPQWLTIKIRWRASMDGNTAEQYQSLKQNTTNLGNFLGGGWPHWYYLLFPLTCLYPDMLLQSPLCSNPRLFMPPGDTSSSPSGPWCCLLTVPILIQSSCWESSVAFTSPHLLHL